MQPSFVRRRSRRRCPPAASLLRDALRRPGGRRGLSVLSLVLMLAGLLVLAYPVGTDVYSGVQQDRLQDAFAQPQVQRVYRERRSASATGSPG